MAGSEDICESCSKPIPPGASVFFQNRKPFHPRCWSRLMQLRAIELADRTRENRATSDKAKERALRLIEKGQQRRRNTKGAPPPA
jgi:hypothetical protein